MFENNGCCTPPQKKDDCCCKYGILCALDFFYQDFLVTGTGNNCIATGTLQYYPLLPPVISGTTQTQIPNTIFGIPYITQDIVPVFPYTGDKDDITYLNLCKLQAFEFQVNTPCAGSIDSIISLNFSKVRYTSPKSCCCKNGLIEYLLKAKDFLLTPPNNNVVYISTPSNTFAFTQILAINKDTVWGKNVVVDTTTTTTYYVVSLCEIVGITFDKYPLITTPQP